MNSLKPFVSVVKGAVGFQRLAGGDNATVRIKSGCVVLKPGESVGEHVTEGREEVILIIKGRAEVHCGGTGCLRLGRHSLIYIPPGRKHDVRNIGRGLLQYVYVVSKV